MAPTESTGSGLRLHLKQLHVTVKSGTYSPLCTAELTGKSASAGGGSSSVVGKSPPSSLVAAAVTAFISEVASKPNQRCCNAKAVLLHNLGCIPPDRSRASDGSNSTHCLPQRPNTSKPKQHNALEGVAEPASFPQMPKGPSERALALKVYNSPE